MANVRRLRDWIARQVQGLRERTRWRRWPAALAGSAVLACGAAFWSGFSELPGETPALSIQLNAFPEPPAPDDSVLSIIQTTPTGTLAVGDLRKEIVVVFNQAMVPLGVLPATVAPVFEISPALAGKFRWYGSRVAAFVPSEPLRPGTRYSVRVPAGAQALNGMRLAESRSFEFATPALALQSKSPYPGRNIDYSPTFRLRFNYPVALAEIRRRVRLDDGENVPFTAVYAQQRRTAAQAEHPDAERDRRRSILIKPSRKLKRDARVELRLPAGLKPEGGSNGLSAAVHLKYKTYGPLKATKKGGAKFFQNLGGLGVYFNNPVKIADFARHAKISPEVKFRRKGSSSVSRVSIGAWDVQPLQRYRVELDADLTDAYGNRLVGERVFEFETPRYRRTYGALQGVDVIESQMKQRVPVSITAMPLIEGKVRKLDLDDIQHYVETGDRHSLALGAGHEAIRWETKLGDDGRARLGFDLAPYLKQNTGWLALRWSNRVEDWKGKERTENRSQLVQATDLGMVVKKGANGSHVYLHSFSDGKPRAGLRVVAYNGSSQLGSCETDADGHCRINHGFHSKRKMFFAARTADGADGAFVTERDHTAYMWGLSVNYDGQAALGRVHGQIVFDRRLYRPGDRAHIKGFLALRRAGGLATGPQALGRIELKISSPNGKTVLQRQLTPSAQGGVEADWQVPAGARLGHYTVHLRSNALGKNSWRGRISETLQVEEFRPVGFTVLTKGLRDARTGETIDLSIRGEYLFGAPMIDAKTRYSLSRRPRNDSFQAYPGFWFGDADTGSYRETPGWQFMSGGSGKLDGKGDYALEFKAAPLAAKDPGSERDKDLQRPYELRIEGYVTDRDDKTVVARSTAIVRPGPAVPGIRAQRSFQSHTKPFEFELVAATAAGSGAQPGPAEVVIQRREWKSIQTKGPGGSVQRKNTLVRKELQRSSVRIGGKPTAFRFQAPEAGSYSIILRKEDGSYSRRTFYATGSGFIGWNFNSDDRIQILPEKRELSPGETARLLVQSPYKSATAIVTVERENVFWQKTYPLKGNAKPLAIPIKAEYIPDVYVSVVLLRPRIQQPPADEAAAKRFREEDLGRPRFAIGVAHLTVSAEAKRLPLALKPDRAKYGPGDPVTIDLRTAPGAEVALTVADRAVLDLLNYRYQDPVDRFYKNWPLGVQTIENRRALIRQLSYANKGESPGGKGAALAKNQEGGFDDEQEDGLRRDFRHTAFWKGKLVADSSGRIRVNFKLPDNLTTFRIMALAAHQGKYNRASSEFKVSRPLVVRPVVPRFIRPGDKLELGGVLTNQTDRKTTFAVKLKLELLKHAGPATREIELPPGQSGEVSFPVTVDGAAYRKLREAAIARENAASDGKAKDQADEARRGGMELAQVTGTLTASATKGGVKDAVRFRFPLREHPPVEAFTVAGFTDEASEEGLALPEKGVIQDDLGRLRVGFSSTALVGIDRAFRFFRTNPYFCLEQRASAFLVGMTAGELLKTFRVEPAKPGGYDFDRTADLFLKDVAAFQNSDGGLRGWKDWPGLSRPYLTAYAVFVMQAAAEANAKYGSDYAVPEKVKARALTFLRNYVRKPRKTGRGYLLETLAMIQYVLVREGIDDAAVTSLESFLLQQVDHMSLRARGHLMLAIAQRRDRDDYRKDEDLKKLMEFARQRMEVNTRRVTFKEATSGSYLRAYYARGSTMAVLLKSFLRLDPQHHAVPLMVRHALTDQKRNYWYDSHGAGQLAHALQGYREVFEKDAPDFTARAVLAGKDLAVEKFKGRETALRMQTFSLAKLLKENAAGETYPLRFLRDGQKGRLYYSASLNYAPAPARAKPREEGIEIRREIRALSGPESGDLAAGDKLSEFPTLKRGELYLYRLIVTNPKPVYDVMIRDNLPSNLEVVREGFSTESAGFARFLQDARRRSGWQRPHYEYRDDAVLVTQEYLAPGVHEYFYLGRALVRGAAGGPAARAFAMYEPEIFGTTAAGIQNVR